MGAAQVSARERELLSPGAHETGLVFLTHTHRCLLTLCGRPHDVPTQGAGAAAGTLRGVDAAMPTDLSMVGVGWGEAILVWYCCLLP